VSKGYIGTIDQGTTSSRFIIFDYSGNIIASHQVEHKQYYPKPGFVEHNPMEILENCREVIAKALLKSKISPDQLKAVGITNQRETIVAWNKKTGKPYYNAIVWQDMRGRSIIDNLISQGLKDEIHKKSGLIPAPYFSASKISWLFENVSEFKKDSKSGDAIVGTIDSWLLWNLSGGKSDSVHYTDVTNASRMLLMNISTMEWDSSLLNMFNIPLTVLPKIVPSIPKHPYAFGKIEVGSDLFQFPLSGILGDQQSALFGQACFHQGQSKCTYGTGGFLLMNVGNSPLFSQNGLLTTVAYQREGEAPCYALEGAVAVAGSSIQWIRDNLGLIDSASEVDVLANFVDDCGGVYFVPAFAGLFAPYWKPGARGIICGLTGYARKEHICRAVLESTAFQVHDLFKAMEQDSGIELPALRVDGGMVVSELVMQMQADLLKVPVIRPQMVETTALGAAYAAGLSVGYWAGFKDLSTHWHEDKRWNPLMSSENRLLKLVNWDKAIQRSYGWV